MFPEKVKKRYEELSSEEHVLSQIQKIQQQAVDEEHDEFEGDEYDDGAYPDAEYDAGLSVSD